MSILGVPNWSILADSRNMHIRPLRRPPDSRNMHIQPLRRPPDSRNMHIRPLRRPPDSRHMHIQPPRRPPDSRNMHIRPLRTPPDSRNMRIQPLRRPPDSGEVSVFSRGAENGPGRASNGRFGPPFWRLKGGSQISQKKVTIWTPNGSILLYFLCCRFAVCQKTRNIQQK